MDFPLPEAGACARQSGFSLLEFLVAVAIAGIVLGLGVPSFQLLQRHTRLETTTDRLMTHLLMARNHAISHGVRVTICPLAGDACGGTGDWTNGWMIFEDVDENRIPDSGERIIAKHAVAADTLRIRFHGSYAYLYYRTNGLGWPNATFRICDHDDEIDGMQVVVRRNGRPRLAQPGDAPVDCGGAD